MAEEKKVTPEEDTDKVAVLLDKEEAQIVADALVILSKSNNVGIDTMEKLLELAKNFIQ
jgi:spermidine/putrescine-binding protein